MHRMSAFGENSFLIQRLEDDEYDDRLVLLSSWLGDVEIPYSMMPAFTISVDPFSQRQSLCRDMIAGGGGGGGGGHEVKDTEPDAPCPE